MSVIWHEVECGAYAADLPLWEEFAAASPAGVLDLGCGTGRVALHLARRGHAVRGVDLDPALVEALSREASGLPVTAGVGDARSFDLGAEFGLVIAPMQLLQLLEDGSERRRCLRCVASHLSEGGLAAFAIVESMPPAAVDAPPPLPDTREVDGWVYSSLPIDAEVDSGSIRIRRLRQIVSPQGGLEEELYEVGLRTLSAAVLEGEAREAGLRPAGLRSIAATDDHVGSTVVLLEREA
jgi:SAM-dependent methyltransferase